MGAWKTDAIASAVTLAVTGGRERTRRQFEQLFSLAGLRLERVEPTPALPHLLVAVPR